MAIQQPNFAKTRDQIVRVQQRRRKASSLTMLNTLDIET